MKETQNSIVIKFFIILLAKQNVDPMNSEYFEKCVLSRFAPAPKIINFSKNINKNDCFHLTYMKHKV